MKINNMRTLTKIRNKLIDTAMWNIKKSNE